MDLEKIILKKSIGLSLSKEELTYAFNGYLLKKITDKEMTLLLKAICKNDMSDRETIDLVDIYINSGEKLNLNEIKGIKVDKHSTGGIGDKTSLIIGPIIAALGLKFVKMSGRGLGYTGGTIDKLESIPGFNVSLTKEEIIKQVNDIGMVITSQTENLVPLDKKIYALRDVTNTTKSIPLIAASIMSKKIVTGTSNVVIDIKVGSGALIEDMANAKRLSSLMIEIAKKYNIKVITIISDMDTPLGDNVGNALEVIEAIEVLKGKKGKLRDLCVNLAASLISLGKNIDINQANKLVLEVLNNGSAYNKYLEFIEYQGGNVKNIKISDRVNLIKASKEGTITEINALEVGKLVLEMGAGRKTKESNIDYGVGIKFKKHIGDKVNIGDIIMELYLAHSNFLYDINKIITIK
ncbi:MAG: thymidine phosphorylase [Tenericutes bacterium]|jgi:pyrimidine-nucleoside phosphorylase|nr:thymidine phosphorylase [Mycoplasmatota bacterium]